MREFGKTQAFDWLRRDVAGGDANGSVTILLVRQMTSGRPRCWETRKDASLLDQQPRSLAVDVLPKFARRAPNNEIRRVDLSVA